MFSGWPQYPVTWILFSKAILPIYPTLNVRFTLYDVCTEDYTPTAAEIAMLVLSTVRTMKLDWKMMWLGLSSQAPRIKLLNAIGRKPSESGEASPIEDEDSLATDPPSEGMASQGSNPDDGQVLLPQPDASQWRWASGWTSWTVRPRDGNLKAMAIASQEHY